jgi:hypothetical protein
VVLCRAAIDWALARTFSTSSTCNDCRWFGEPAILVYDWCHPHLTAAERSTLTAKINAFLWEYVRPEFAAGGSYYGDPPMHQNNFYWGRVRNELLWAIASWGENTAPCGAKTCPEAFLDDVLERRLAADFHPATLGDSKGGFAVEGTEYGPYLHWYSVTPFVSAGLLGRDLYGETNFWKESVYAYIYSTTPAPTAQAAGGSGYTFFPNNDDGYWTTMPDQATRTHGVGNFMAAAAMRWGGVNVGKHARHWLNLVSAERSRHVQAVDPGGSALAFDGLPLDYYAPGPRWMFSRNAWGPNGTVVWFQMGDRATEQIVGHNHLDYGSFQLWRKGRFLSRETVGYTSENGRIAGYAGSGASEPDLGVGHNGVLVNGHAASTSQYENHDRPIRPAVVRRLESRPGYAFASVDLSPIATQSNGNPAVVHLERDYVFVRGLETLVVLDRVQSDTAARTKTFVNHCEVAPTGSGNDGRTCAIGGQSLVMTTLLPPQRTYRVLNEGGTIGQHRIEVDTTPGTAQSYILTVLQAKDSAAPSLSPSVVDGGASYTVTLDASTSITFAKGMVSSGGSITLAGGTTPLRADVQQIRVADSGPAWQ